MRGQLLLLALTATTPTWSQVAPSASGGSPTVQMMTPPPVSDTGYTTAVGAEEQSNYLRFGLTEETSYIDNLYASSGSASIAETTVSVLPSITFETSTFRRQMTAAYSPGFTFYRPSSSLNEVDNSATLNFDFRLTPHTSINAIDSFQDSSTTFSPTDAGSSGIVSGAPESSTPGVAPPFAKRLTNNASAEFTAQTAMNTMIGASGLSTTLEYPNPSEATGLYNSSSHAGTVFYNHRISMAQYFGGTFQYLNMLAHPAGESSTTQTQTVTGFYSLYLKSKLSFSVSGGPQRYQSTQAPLPTSSAWGPSISVSMGGQGTRSSLAASYSQSVTGGGGLLGAFHSRSASAMARWQMLRTWLVSTSGSYSINKSVSPILLSGTQSGHSVLGRVALEHTLGDQLAVRFDYERLHQSYDDIPSIASNPDSDRGTVSLIWQFTRPLGR